MILRALLLACGLMAGGAAGTACAGCRTLAITAAAITGAGRPVVGIEDLAVDGPAGRLVLSAYDRRADAEHAGGGLFLLPLAALDAPDAERAEALDLTAGFHPVGGFRPHGIDLRIEPDGRRAVLSINRRHDGTTVVERFGLTGATLSHQGTIDDPLLCRANDVAFLDGGRILFTSDHGGCGWLAVAVENVLNLHRGFVGIIEDGHARVLADGIGFANGLLPDAAADRLYVAATRERAVLVYRLSALLDGRDAAPHDRIAMPGAPDNLSMTGGGGPWDGRVLAAVHPSLFAFALHRHGLPGGGMASARVVAFGPTHVETIADVVADGDGRHASAATVAAAWGNRLIAGSVMSDRLLVCDGGSSDASRSSGWAARSAPTRP